MSSTVLSQIEKTISQLSHDEMLWLIEKLAHHLREETTKNEAGEQDAFESQLVAMVSDSEVRVELQKIEREFVATEIDGLGRY